MELKPHGVAPFVDILPDTIDGSRHNPLHSGPRPFRKVPTVFSFFVSLPLVFSLRFFFIFILEPPRTRSSLSYECDISFSPPAFSNPRLDRLFAGPPPALNSRLARNIVFSLSLFPSIWPQQFFCSFFSENEVFRFTLWFFLLVSKTHAFLPLPAPCNASRLR